MLRETSLRRLSRKAIRATTSDPRQLNDGASTPHVKIPVLQLIEDGTQPRVGRQS